MNSTKPQSTISVSYHSMAIKRKQIIAIVPILSQKNSTFRPHLSLNSSMMKYCKWYLQWIFYNRTFNIRTQFFFRKVFLRWAGIEQGYFCREPFLTSFFNIRCIEKVFSCRKLDLMQICNLDVKREECAAALKYHRKT